MNTITYTKQVGIASSDLVDEVYFNENTGDLYVDLDTSVYKYQSVPADVVDAFEAAPSAGTFYNSNIKGKFSSDNIGSWSLLDYVEISKAEPVTVSTSGVVTGSTISPNSSFSLKPFNDNGVAKVEGIERDYAVTFEVDGLNGRKTHTLKSTSVDDAVATVLDLGKMLDLTFIVREVVITFE